MLFNQNRKNSKNRFRTGNYVFVIILALLAMSLLAGCPNPAGTDDPGELDAPVLKATAQGIEITVIVPDGADHMSISRNVDHVSSLKTAYSRSTNNEEALAPGATTVIDYFVEAGKEYEYFCTFYAVGTTGTHTKKARISATGGLGEMRITNKPEASYNDETGDLTFSVKPEIAPKNSGMDVSILLQCWHKDTWSTSVDMGGAGEFNIAKRHPRLIGDTLRPQFWWIQMSRGPISGDYHENWKGGYNYDVSGMPESMDVPDNRPGIDLEATDDGVRVTVNVPDNTGSFWVSRSDGSSDEESVYNRSASWSPTLSAGDTTFTDYFVDAGKEYEYSCKFIVSGTINIDTRTESITATGGSGELRITNSPAATYDAGTAILTFTVKPETEPAAPVSLLKNVYLYCLHDAVQYWGIEVPETGVEIDLTDDCSHLAGKTLEPEHWGIMVSPPLSPSPDYYEEWRSAPDYNVDGMPESMDVPDIAQP